MRKRLQWSGVHLGVLQLRYRRVAQWIAQLVGLVPQISVLLPKMLP